MQHTDLKNVAYLVRTNNEDDHPATWHSARAGIV